MTRAPDADFAAERHRAAAGLITAALQAGREVRLRLWGTSMIPAIWPGDEVLVSPTAQAPPAKGAIILFLRSGRLFAHRVVARDGDRLITRGDAVADCDPPVPAGDLLGVVTGIVQLPATGLQRVIRVGPPSLTRTVIAFAIRRSEVAHRLAVGWNRLSRLRFSAPERRGAKVRL